MNDRVGAVAVFVATVQAGSFAAASERLHLTRSAVGKSIARLEERLGTRLFHRTTRSQSLTEAGQAYYERCLRALAELDAAEAELAAGRTSPTGRLRVSMPSLFGRRCVAPILIELTQRHPQLELEISFSDRRIDLIEEGFDLAVRSGPLPDSSSLAARPLGQQRMVVCATPGYLARHPAPATLADLAAHEGLNYAKGGDTLIWRFLGPDGRLIEIPMRGRWYFDELEAIEQAALAGLGLAWLPHWLIADHLCQGRLVQVLGQVSPFAFDLNLVWPQTRHLPSKVRVAIDELSTRLPQLLAQPCTAGIKLPA
jgi:DNA-binding transcriptional LysR family regulator